MINFIIPIIRQFLPIWTTYLLPIFCFAFIVTVPCVIRGIIKRV